MSALDITKETFFVEGVVLENNEHRYSSTEVHGDISTTSHGHTFGNISSTVRHHNNQTIWLALASGKERPFRFFNNDIAVREGHHVVVICNRLSGAPERVVNKTTQRYWHVGLAYPKSKQIFSALLQSGIVSLPFLSLLFIVVPWFQRIVAPKPKGYWRWRTIFMVGAIVMTVSVTGMFSRTARDVLPAWRVSLSADTQALMYTPLDYALQTFISLFVDERLYAERAERQSIEYKNAYDKSRHQAQIQKYAQMSRTERIKDMYQLRDSFWKIWGGSQNSYFTPAIFMYVVCVFACWMLLIRNNRMLSDYRQKLDEYCSFV